MHAVTDSAYSAPRALSRDTQTTLLLTARLGDKPRLLPLNRREYNTVAASLLQQELRPGHLLDDGVLERLLLDPRIVTAERLRFLLGRASALAFAVDGWANAGLWVVSRGDPEYPRRIRRALKAESPPLFYGAGSVERLKDDGIGVVGSRDVDDAGVGFARRLGRLCAAQGLLVVSGAARGVDSEAMLAAADSGGGALGIVAGDLERHALSKAWRGALREGSVTLLSSFEPSARFTVGYAMERNRYVYTMSRFVVVVASATGEGGTWAGAVENLEAGWSPLVVRAEEGAPAGNAALIKRGATPLHAEDMDNRTDLRALYRRAAEEQRARGGSAAEALELPFELGGANVLASAASTGEAPMSGPSEASDSPPLAAPHQGASDSLHPADRERESASPEDGAAVDVFALVLPYIEKATASPRTFDDLKQLFPGVLESQLKAWLTRAVEEGRIQRGTRPLRYTRS